MPNRDPVFIPGGGILSGVLVFGAGLLRLAATSVALASFAAFPALSDGGPRADVQSVAEPVLRCLSNGMEAVLFRDKAVECAPFSKGARLLPRGSAFDVDVETACKDPADLRRLPGNFIKVIAQQGKEVINPTGIRILGGVFCEELDLVGLEIPYSLVLDRSVFVRGIQGRSFRTHSDLSFDGSLVLDEVFLARTHVDGTIFASGSAINKLRLLDAEVHGSVLFRGSVFLDLAAFDTVQLSGELSVRNALFPYLLIQFSKIGGVVDLKDSQARCAYRVRKSEIGDVVAINSGFGTVETSSQQQQKFYDWSIPKGADMDRLLQPLLRGQKYVRKLISEETHHPPPSDDIDRICDRQTISFSPVSFLISDTRIKSSFCLRSFRWPEASETENSYVTLNDLTVGTAASIDIGRPKSTPLTNDAYASRRLEIIGFETGSFFLNFNDPKRRQPYTLSLSGLKFAHVYASDIACDYDPDFSNRDSDKATRPSLALANDADPGARSRPLNAEQVMGWLNANSLATTQPFAAFVEVFQKEGDDNNSKSLLVEKASAELCQKARRLLGKWWTCMRGADPSEASKATAQGQTAPAENQARRPTLGDGPLEWFFWLGGQLIDWGNEIVSIVLGAFLRLIADNGYHPEKVGWFVAFAIVGFGIYFWLWLRVIGIKPKNKPNILPIGFVFLFDRLLPAYQIREDHYKIDKFLKRLPKNHGLPPGQFQTMRYLGRTFDIVNATAAEKLGIERTLDVLKVIGLILAVFLVAAINSIVSH